MYQPEKWNGRNTVPDATRSVTRVLTLMRALVGVSTHTYSSFLTPRSLASLGLISTNISCCSSASQGLERVSSPPPSYSTRRPDVMIRGKSFDQSFACSDLYSVGRRQKVFLSSYVGYLATRSGRGLSSGSRCTGTGSGKFQTSQRARALP